MHIYMFAENCSHLVCLFVLDERIFDEDYINNDHLYFDVAKNVGREKEVWRAVVVSV